METIGCDQAVCLCRAQDTGNWITKDRNSPSRDMANCVEEIRDWQPDPAAQLEYFDGRGDREADAVLLREQVAAREGVAPSDVLLMASSNDWLGTSVAQMNRRNLVMLEDDFPGFQGGASKRSPVLSVGVGRNGVDLDELAATVAEAKRPMTFFTFPFTNPGMTATSLEMVQVALDASREGMVVIDAAYTNYLRHGENLARFARRTPRAVFLRPASKFLMLCGARVSWVICHPELRPMIEPTVRKFPVDPLAASQALHVLGTPGMLERMVRVQERSRDILQEGFRARGYRIIAGAAPWVLVHFGRANVLRVQQHFAEHKIAVQVAGGPYIGWVRISATVPYHEERTLKALDALELDARAA